MDPTALAPSGGGGSSPQDVSVIVIVSGCVGGLFLIVLLVFIIFVICVLRKQMKEDVLAKRPSRKGDHLDWKTRPFVAQFGDINDIDQMLWTGRGREANAETDNPAFDKDDMEPLDVNNLKFDSTYDDDAASTRETESSSDMVEVDLNDEDQPDAVAPAAAPAEDDTQDKKQISILDMKTWGQPGTSRQNSMRSSEPTFRLYRPSDDDDDDDTDNDNDDGPGAFNREADNTVPTAPNSRHKKSTSSDTKRDMPVKTVSNPANDPRFQYTRVNPLVGGGRIPYDGFPFSGFDKKFGKHRDFGGTEDIHITDYDKYGTLGEPQRNQSVVDFYESGTRSTASGLSLSIEMDDSIGKKMLWQKNKISVMGFGK